MSDTQYWTIRVQGQIDLWSTATDGDDDFERITLFKVLFRETTARHDFTVAFEGNTLAAQFKTRKQVGAIERPVELAAFAVDGY
jgi:hypothetical protein